MLQCNSEIAIYLGKLGAMIPQSRTQGREATMTTQFEVPVDLRDFAQKSVEQARKAFEGFVAVAQKTADAVDSAGANMRASAKTVSSQALGYAEQNVNAAFDFANKLVQVKDPQEALTLQH